MQVYIKRVRENSDLPLPTYQTEWASGVDLQADITETVYLKSLERKVVPTGFSIALPQGYEAQIRPRSGLALKKGLSIPNAPGTIDADYRGEICVILINLGQETIAIERGDRIAQMVVAPVVQMAFTLVDDLDDTERGQKGFGSTGT